jgi:hypothetical protein
MSTRRRGYAKIASSDRWNVPQALSPTARKQTASTIKALRSRGFRKPAKMVGLMSKQVGGQALVASIVRSGKVRFSSHGTPGRPARFRQRGVRTLKQKAASRINGRGTGAKRRMGKRR